MVTCKVVALIIAFLVRLRKVTMSVQHSKKGTGKTRNEMGNGKREMKMGIFIHNCIACPPCIQQHLLEQTSATGDSGEEVVQDGQNLFMGSTS